jgi:enterochelin esterase family protein
MGAAEGTRTRLAPTAVENDEIVFRLSDPDHEHDGVSVWFDLVTPAEWPDDLRMAECKGGWELRLPVPDLDCFEYLFRAGDDLAPDPGNPDQVEGAFGPHSFLAMPGYHPPAWLDQRARPGRRHQLSVGDVDVDVWEPGDPDDEEGPLPLLIVHDGAQMDEFGGVTRYAATLAPMRVALLSPGSNRDERYAANPAYTEALAEEVVPALIEEFRTFGKPVLLGQSLGGLAALHAGWLFPDTFAGLMMQSGSFFTPVLDPQESGYAHFDDVVGFVASVHESTGAPLDFPPVALTCGTAEENLANNRLLHTHLLDLGVTAAWGEVRQGHTWTCWRDSLHPHLADLLDEVW